MKKLLLLVVCLALNCALADAQNRDSAPIIKIGDKNYYIHTIESGQTVSSISRQYNVLPRTIIAENPMAVEILRPGQILKIPVQSSDKPLSRRAIRKNFVEHKITAGETLYSIARKYDISITELMSDNSDVDPVSLGIGKTLLIRRKGIGSSNQSELNDELNRYKENLDKLSDDYIHHIVTAKETIYGLCKQYAANQEHFFELNPEVKESGLKIGAIVRLPRVARPITPIEEQPTAQTQHTQPDTLVFNTIPAAPNPPVFKPAEGVMRVALMLPFTIDGQPNESFIDFYRGVLMALGELKNDGTDVSLTVIDTERSADKVYHTLNHVEFQHTNLIIGPVYNDTFERAAMFARQNNIPIISPLAQVSAQSPNVFQIAPEKHKRTELLKQYLESDRNIIVIRPDANADDEFASEIMPLLPENRHHIEYNNQTEITIIDSLLSVEKENLVVLLSSEENLTEEILARVRSSQNTIAAQGGITPRIHVLGSSKLSRFQNLDKELYFKLNVTYPTNYHADRSNEKVAQFDKLFLGKFNKMPSVFAYRGYEVAMLFLSNLESNLTDNILLGRYVYLQMPYKFERTESGKIVNNQWQLVHYKNDYTIELLNFETY